MYYRTPKSSPPKQQDLIGSESMRKTDLSRYKPAQLPTPPQTQFDAPSRRQFTFTHGLSPSPTRHVNKQEKPSTFVAATDRQDSSDVKKGYGFEYPEESVEANAASDVLPNSSASRLRRPIVTPQRLRRSANEETITHFQRYSRASGNSTLTPGETAPFSTRAKLSNSPAPYVEEVEDEEKTRSSVKQKIPSSQNVYFKAQTRKCVLPSPPPTPLLQAGPSEPAKSTQMRAAATTNKKLQGEDIVSSDGSETDTDEEIGIKYTRLHSWKWPVVSKSGNFEIRSPSASPAAKRKQNKVRHTPVAPPPSPFASLSLPQMKDSATVRPKDIMAHSMPPSSRQKWSPPRFARRDGDPMTAELALMLGSLGFTESRGKGKKMER